MYFRRTLRSSVPLEKLLQFSIFYVFILKNYLNTKIIEEIYFTYDEKNEKMIM